MKPSELTDEQLNEEIAKLRGWKINPLVIDFGLNADVSFKYVSPDGKCQSRCPNFCNSWEWAGELLEEMKDEGIELSFGPNHDYSPTINQWCVHFPNWNINYRGIITFSDSPTRAIAEAYLEVNQ